MLGFDALAKLALATLPQEAPPPAGAAGGLVGRGLLRSILLAKRSLVS